MDLNENKENIETKTENKKWKAWEKNLLAGAICFTVGLSGPIAVSMYVKHQTKTAQQATIDRLREEKRSLKKQLETQKEKIVTVPVYITEPVTEAKETAPVTEIVTTETVKARKETAPVTDVPEKETTEFVAGTPSEETQYKLKVATNPLTKKALAPSQVKVSDEWKVYWIDITRSDLAGLKPDDFKFFYDYINENFEKDDCEFNIVVTDVPGLCFQCNVTSSDYIKSLCEIYAGIKAENNSKYYPYVKNGSCALRFTDSNQFEIQPFIKDKYGLEQLDDEQFYYYPEFNKEMFDKLMELQENAEFLWG